MEVENDCEIEPALTGGNIGDVADDLFSWSGGRSRLREEIGRRTGGVVLGGGLRAKGSARTSSQAVLVHEPGDAVLGAVLSSGPELVSHARAAVGMGVTVRVNGLDLVEELLIGCGSGGEGTLLSGEVAAAGHLQSLAEF